MKKTPRQYQQVEIGETFHQAGWRWTVVEVAPSGRKYWAETPLPGRTPLRREFSALIGEMYYGEPDRDDEDAE